ncbi:hypothetical protein RO3G_15424 [Rhizopus delemar RA 99-880]|uniref:Uncharacterized protein n=1 Tax=Rhizopus delemar (strain RA 99-880 / ATCC MYA-4621 / FGSC 9543 / NRRL 43880) TaxID=246409 RepID=I1CQI3_RHIO9|nr:hypothetical protein RO3G_15424 [Rhizopus delemar RA 99-880]|eukprot:EIE90713.1 hypothetical protein RO3G_15424 [Rhizopus delemar RA 99-880]
MDSTAIQPDIAQNFLPVTVFLAAWHVRVTWIAFTTLWVFWGLIWFLRHAFGGDGSHINQTNAQAYTNPPATATDPETGAAINTGAANTGPATGPATNQKKFLAAPAWGANVFRRVNRAHDMLRDLILMLLSVLVINSFARGSTRAVMILAWIYVAFAFVYFFVELGYEHRFVRLLYSITFYGISLAIIGCAWQQGFYV